MEERKRIEALIENKLSTLRNENERPRMSSEYHLAIDAKIDVLNELSQAIYDEFYNEDNP